jgi:hypothetical protein
MFSYKGGKIVNEKGKVLMPQPKWKDADQKNRYIYAVDDGKTTD